MRSILLSNMMFLAPKIDVVRYYATFANLDLICLTETWLQERIPDSIASINGFNVVRLDRQTSVHGGVYLNIKDSDNPSFEVLWIKTRPTRPPRGVGSIVIGTVHPPNANNSAMLSNLMDCLSSIESQHTNCGIILLGDFNGLNVSNLKSSFKLKQIVNFPTTDQNTPDFILLISKTFTILLTSAHLSVYQTIRLLNLVH